MMATRLWGFLLSVAVVCGVSGCGVQLSPSAAREFRQYPAADRNAVLGTWYRAQGQSAQFLHVAPEGAGVRIAALDSVPLGGADSRRSMGMLVMEGFLVQVGERSVAIVREDPSKADDPQPGYAFVPYRVHDGRLSLYPLKREVLAKAVEEGVVRGRVVEGQDNGPAMTVTVEESESFARWLNQHTDGQIFSEAQHFTRLRLDGEDE